MIPTWVYERNVSKQCPGRYIDFGGGAKHDRSACQAAYCKCSRMLAGLVRQMESSIQCAGPVNYSYLKDLLNSFLTGPREFNTLWSDL